MFNYTWVENENGTEVCTLYGDNVKNFAKNATNGRWLTVDNEKNGNWCGFYIVVGNLDPTDTQDFYLYRAKAEILLSQVGKVILFISLLLYI